MPKAFKSTTGQVLGRSSMPLAFCPDIFMNVDRCLGMIPIPMSINPTAALPGSFKFAARRSRGLSLAAGVVTTRFRRGRRPTTLPLGFIESASPDPQPQSREGAVRMAANRLPPQFILFSRLCGLERADLSEPAWSPSRTLGCQLS